MHDLCILNLESLFFLNILLKVLEQGINSSIIIVLSGIDPEVIPRQLLCQTDLSKAQAFCIHEVLNIVLVCKHENFMLAVF